MYSPRTTAKQPTTMSPSSSPVPSGNLSRFLPFERSSSAPPESSEKWIPREKPHKLTTAPTRSLSLKVRKDLDTAEKQQPRKKKKDLGKSHLAKSFKPSPISEEDEQEEGGKGKGEEQQQQQQLELDSEDEEDIRNGVPTKISGNSMRPFKLSMKLALEDEFASLNERGSELAARLNQYKPVRESLRDLYFSSELGKNWSVAMWDEFLGLETKYNALQDELWDIESRMEGLCAEMYLFLNCRASAFQGEEWRATWKSDGVVAVRAICEGGGGGACDEHRGPGRNVGEDEFPRLLWNGVDFSEVSQARYLGRYPQHFAVGVPW